MNNLVGYVSVQRKLTVALDVKIDLFVESNSWDGCVTTIGAPFAGGEPDLTGIRGGRCRPRAQNEEKQKGQEVDEKFARHVLRPLQYAGLPYANADGSQ